MKSVNIKIKGKINFKHRTTKQYNKTFEAVLIDNKAAFPYGNGKMVIIKYGKDKNGHIKQSEYLDVRYVKMQISEKGLVNYISDYFGQYLAEHTLTIKFKNKKED